MEQNDVRLKAMRLLLPLAKKKVLADALQEYDISIEWNDEANSPEVSFIDKPAPELRYLKSKK